MSEMGRCKDCKHWDVGNVDAGSAECLKGIRQYRTDRYNCTRFDFGCVRFAERPWEPKPEDTITKGRVMYTRIPGRPDEWDAWEFVEDEIHGNVFQLSVAAERVKAKAQKASGITH